MQESHWIFHGKTKNADGMACFRTTYSCGDFAPWWGTWEGFGCNPYWQESNTRREFLVGQVNSRYWICTNAFSGNIQNVATHFHPGKHVLMKQWIKLLFIQYFGKIFFSHVCWKSGGWATFTVDETNEYQDTRYSKFWELWMLRYFLRPLFLP